MYNHVYGVCTLNTRVVTCLFLSSQSLLFPRCFLLQSCPCLGATTPRAEDDDAWKERQVHKETDPKKKLQCCTSLLSESMKMLHIYIVTGSMDSLELWYAMSSLVPISNPPMFHIIIVHKTESYLPLFDIHSCVLLVCCS